MGSNQDILTHENRDVYALQYNREGLLLIHRAIKSGLKEEIEFLLNLFPQYIQTNTRFHVPIILFTLYEEKYWVLKLLRKYAVDKNQFDKIFISNLIMFPEHGTNMLKEKSFPSDLITPWLEQIKMKFSFLPNQDNLLNTIIKREKMVRQILKESKSAKFFESFCGPIFYNAEQRRILKEEFEISHKYHKRGIADLDVVIDCLEESVQYYFELANCLKYLIPPPKKSSILGIFSCCRKKTSGSHQLDFYQNKLQ